MVRLDRQNTRLARDNEPGRCRLEMLGKYFRTTDADVGGILEQGVPRL